MDWNFDTLKVMCCWVHFYVRKLCWYSLQKMKMVLMLLFVIVSRVLPKMHIIARVVLVHNTVPVSNLYLYWSVSFLLSVDPFTKKDWYDVKAPSMFVVRQIGKTLVTRTQGTSKLFLFASEMWTLCDIWQMFYKLSSLVWDFVDLVCLN